MTPDNRFLQSVASYLLDRCDNLADYTLVFPNKRSALFLKKYIHDRLRRSERAPRFMPRFATMGNFISRFATRLEMPRTEQLFLLFDCYREVLAELGRSEQLGDFDKFIFWGGIILDDFSDIDRQLVDAAKLFKNLKDLKEINADYLSDDQKEVVRQIWGETPRTAAVSEFWTHVNHLDGDTPESRFVNLWELLGDLYRRFTDRLHRAGYDTAAGQYRDAASVVAQTPADQLTRRHYCFIGFSDLSHSEILILKRLKDLGAADFFWDFDSELMSLALKGHIATLHSRLKKTFPMPVDFVAPVADTLPSIEILPVPSAVVQTKAVHSILNEWIEDGTLTDSNSIGTAVVLPDENLLTPLLYSIPDGLRQFNVTMGVPFSSTPFAAMLHSIVSMQIRSRVIRGDVYYYYADVIDLLSHPHIQIIAPKVAEKIKYTIDRNKLFNVKAADLCRDFPTLSFLFAPVKDADDPTQICSYMTTLIDTLASALSGPVASGGKPAYEIEMLRRFSADVNDLNRLISRYSITMGGNTYFSLVERIMHSQRIDLQGTPLVGLQVMGVLETRALDFDNIVIISVNENSFPRKSYMRTMIPNNLRVGYGMTTIDRQDSLYTYYFYRLLSRARRVRLIYDSRTGSLGAGEPSRYIAQLHNIMPAGNIAVRKVDLPSEVVSPEPLTVIKDDVVKAELDSLRGGIGRSNISVSALKEYQKCRLRFYLKYVKNMRGETEIQEGIPSSVYGKIVHRVSELLFQPFEGQLVTADLIRGMLDNPADILDLVHRVIIDEYYHKSGIDSSVDMPAEGRMTADIIVRYITIMLQADMANTPFTYVKGEKKVRKPWQLTPDLTINFTMSIDRVDMIEPGYLRFIDYKTGSDKADNTTLDKMFERGNSSSDAMFQLLTYALAYGELKDPGVAIKPVVYPLRQVAKNNEAPQFIVDGEVIEDYRTLAPAFRERFVALVSEIFDPDVPFDQCDDNKNCKFCPFLDLCGRSEPKNHY